jgi:hypothetical protein
MLRGGRAPPMGSLVDSLRGAPVVAPRDLLLAMAPLPRGEAFSVAGWPRWLLPPEVSLARMARTKELKQEETE